MQVPNVPSTTRAPKTKCPSVGSTSDSHVTQIMSFLTPGQYVESFGKRLFRLRGRGREISSKGLEGLGWVFSFLLS